MYLYVPSEQEGGPVWCLGLLRVRPVVIRIWYIPSLAPLVVRDRVGFAYFRLHTTAIQAVCVARFIHV